ncbi:LysR substrate-binding domain-containing protein [Thermoleophilum album]|uniref:LysR substrate-binding domain-containing protein n=1 Tax=Thermoleophilum album TaxID=29539 RepID=UPI00237C58B2|nr:LysR substrate-binding domain-containing protein [Thermoleophilum album]
MARLHDEGGPLVELFVANSQIVRRLGADGSADIGVAARRPGATPNPSVEEREICPDELVCAVARAHPWALRGTIALAERIAAAAARAQAVGTDVDTPPAT